MSLIVKALLVESHLGACSHLSGDTLVVLTRNVRKDKTNEKEGFSQMPTKTTTTKSCRKHRTVDAKGCVGVCVSGSSLGPRCLVWDLFASLHKVFSIIQFPT